MIFAYSYFQAFLLFFLLGCALLLFFACSYGSAVVLAILLQILMLPPHVKMTIKTITFAPITVATLNIITTFFGKNETVEIKFDLLKISFRWREWFMSTPASVVNPPITITIRSFRISSQNLSFDHLLGAHNMKHVSKINSETRMKSSKNTYFPFLRWCMKLINIKFEYPSMEVHLPMENYCIQMNANLMQIHVDENQIESDVLLWSLSIEKPEVKITQLNKNVFHFKSFLLLFKNSLFISPLSLNIIFYGNNNQNQNNEIIYDEIEINLHSFLIFYQLYQNTQMKINEYKIIHNLPTVGKIRSIQGQFFHLNILIKDDIINIPLKLCFKEGVTATMSTQINHKENQIYKRILCNCRTLSGLLLLDKNSNELLVECFSMNKLDFNKTAVTSDSEELPGSYIIHITVTYI